jgi:mono/diheme cytochrome c family protein
LKRIALFAACWIFAVPLAALQVQQPNRPPQAAPAGNIEEGKKHFKTHGCVACHGYTGQGGAGARLAQNPPAFQAFVSYVRKPSGTMPPYGSQVTEAQLADIYAYLKSIQPSPDPKTVPLLNQVD